MREFLHAVLTRILPAVLLALCLHSDASAQDETLSATIAKFADAGNFNAVDAVIDEIAALGDDRAVAALNALSDGELQIRADTRQVVIVAGGGARANLLDPVTGEVIAPAGDIKLDKVKIKNSLRRKIAAALSGLTLLAKRPEVRHRAAQTIFSTADASQAEVLDQAIEAEQVDWVREVMLEARASIVLSQSADLSQVEEAIDTIAARGDRDALALLTKFAMWEAGRNIWYGLSLGSVLFLAAIGLAITFGVMGVINMAHGEMVMIGAYTTFVVQDIIRQSAPGLFDYSLALALPAAFLMSGAVGLAMERGIIRHLYGRPLETLLATWGVSLILQQTVRTIFGPTNREVGNPSWMSGAFQLGEMSITWNRLWILVFSLCVFVALIQILNRTSFGLQVRAVTQNRRMASSMGIRTPWVDAFTFALGSGIAGIAGVALSQIDNVSPNLGQGYIIDSFMVVVFGGVGNLWGTLIGAMSLGVANKFLEPYAGAVLGKILVLIFIILFIQRRPRGLFALKGRAVEA